MFVWVIQDADGIMCGAYTDKLEAFAQARRGETAIKVALDSERNHLRPLSVTDAELDAAFKALIDLTCDRPEQNQLAQSYVESPGLMAATVCVYNAMLLREQDKN